MTISFDEWQKLDIRTATILEAEDHPNADKLIVLKIDLGGKQRTIVAGIKEFYNKEDLKGKQIVVFTNLESANLRGIKSEGMLLAADENGKAVLLAPEKKVNNGTKIR